MDGNYRPRLVEPIAVGDIARSISSGYKGEVTRMYFDGGSQLSEANVTLEGSNGARDFKWEDLRLSSRNRDNRESERLGILFYLGDRVKVNNGKYKEREGVIEQSIKEGFRTSLDISDEFKQSELVWEASELVAEYTKRVKEVISSQTEFNKYLLDRTRKLRLRTRNFRAAVDMDYLKVDFEEDMARMVKEEMNYEFRSVDLVERLAGAKMLVGSTDIRLLERSEWIANL